MRAVVTGAAGFIGSHLVDRLLADEHDVLGIDSFSQYYDTDQKRGNIRAALDHSRFQFLAQDLATCPLEPVLDGADVVFHLAAQAGVRASWASGFSDYVLANVAVTQRLLEASRLLTLSRFVYASSSSVYGNAASYPTREDALPAPESPYGVTKLAGEHLVRLYDSNWGLPTTSLRYFSVYGPRQRPDMGLHGLIEAGLTGALFPLFGDGTQIREFTYVGDVVDATLLGATPDLPSGLMANIAGGSAVTMLETLDLVGQQLGQPVGIDRMPEQAGDVKRTGGVADIAHDLLKWRVRTSFEHGVAAQIAWHRQGRR